MPDQPSRRLRLSARVILPPLLVFVLAAAAYTATLAPGVLGGDAGELQFVPHILSLSHPTGYPLQTLLNKLWTSVLPFGSVAWRTNLLSALAAASGVALVWALVRRSTGSWLAASAGTLLLAVSPVYWGQAVLGDKYALNGFLTALLLVAAWRFARRPGSAASWAALGAAAGLGLAHHRSFLAFGPVLAVFGLYWARGALKRPVLWLAGAAGLIAPLLLYAYVPLASQRALPPYQPPIHSVQELAAYLQDAGYLGQVGLLPKPENIAAYVQTLVANFGWLALALGGAAVVAALVRRKQPAWLLFLLSSFLIQAYLTQNYAVPRQFVFYIPAYVCLAVLLGTAAGLAFQPAAEPRAPAQEVSQRAWSVTLLWILPLFLLAAGLVRLPGQWRVQLAEQTVETPLNLFRQDLKSGRRGDRMAASLALAPPRSLISADWEQATALWYAQQVDGVCPDCLILSQMENNLQQHSEQAAAEGRPLLVARTVNGAGDWSEPTALGPLAWLQGQPAGAVPPGLTGLDIRFDGTVSLLGYTWPLGVPQVQRGRVLPVALAWQALSPAPDYALSLRLLNGEKKVWQADLNAPVLGMQPFSKLAPGQVIQDYYEIPLGEEAAPGRYALTLLLYEAKDGGFTNAEATDANGQSLGSMVEVLAFDLP